jgi:acyl carrier protein
MDEAQIRGGVIAAIQAVAPELEADELQASQPLRDQVDLDSMDWLNVIVGFHERFAVDIPEADYVQLTSLDAIVTYLRAKLS